MSNKLTDNVKLGLFLLGGVLFLVIMLYMIGRNQHLFGKTYLLKARFENVNGLVAGNNVRVSGIQAGSVKRIVFLSDSVIEVSMLIDTEMKNIIRKNSVVSIGTDGLVGNKVINITPGRGGEALATEGDVLLSEKGVNTEEMLRTLSKTNDDVAAIARQLKITTGRLNESQGLWQLINDESIPVSLRRAAINIQQAAVKANEMANNLNEIISDVKNGNGSLGSLLTDTSMSANLNEAVSTINDVAGQTRSIAGQLDSLVTGLNRQLNNQDGTIYTLLNDSLTAAQFRQSMLNIENATDGFNQNMEALKHNFLFRGYFRKMEKQQKKAKAAEKN